METDELSDALRELGSFDSEVWARWTAERMVQQDADTEDAKLFDVVWDFVNETAIRIAMLNVWMNGSLELGVRADGELLLNNPATPQPPQHNM